MGPWRGWVVVDIWNRILVAGGCNCYKKGVFTITWVGATVIGCIYFLHCRLLQLLLGVCTITWVGGTVVG